MHTYFISDLHLNPKYPAVVTAFFKFLEKQAPSADALYILGDLFEYWIGDDAAERVGAPMVLAKMAKLAKQVPCYFIAGNRDFLVGEVFSQKTGFTVLPDETVIDLYGTPTLLLHGDSLCIDDHAHQAFRSEVTTNLEWQKEFLSVDIPARIELAQEARKHSQTNKPSISMGIMDVTDSAVVDAFEQNEVLQMIHGHTHRQAVHQHQTQNGMAQRYVLGDWVTTDSILRADSEGLQISNKPIRKNWFSLAWLAFSMVLHGKMSRRHE